MTSHAERETVARLVPVRTILFVAMAIVLLAVAGIYGHVRVMSDPTHTVGFALVLDHVFNLLVAAAMFAIFFVAGKRLLSLGGFEWNSFAEEFVFSTCTGAAALALLTLAAALAHLLNPYVIAIIFLVVLALCGTQVLRLLEVARAVASQDYSHPAEVGYILGFAAVALVLLIRALAPPNAADEGIYHLAAVKRFLEAGSLTPLYDIAQGNTHMLVHMLYAPCLMIGADSAAKLLSVGFALLVALSLYAYSSRFLDKPTGYVAALGFFGAGMIMEVATTARIDVTLAGVLFLATYAMTVYLEGRSLEWLWLSGFLSGVAISIKLTGLIWVAILGCIYLMQTLNRASLAERLRHIRFGVVYFGILVTVVSPWLLKNYVYFHNPLYPFASSETVTDDRSQGISYFGPAEEEKLESYFQKAKARNGELAESIREILGRAAVIRPERHPLWFWGYFTNRDLYNVNEPYHTPNYLFLLCPLFLLFGRERRLLWLAAACVVFFVVMALSAWTARYLLPLYPPLTLISAYGIVRTTRWLTRRNAMAKALPAIALLLITCATLLVETTQIIKRRELNYLNGSLSRADFMNQIYCYPSLRYVNENARRESKVLMLGCQMGYDLQRTYVADTTWDSTPWRRLLLKADTPEGIRDAMKAEGITHVIYSPAVYVLATVTGRLSIASRLPAKGRPDYYEQWRNWTTFEEFKAKYLEPAYRDKYGCMVFVMR
jgi:hypothetical protein